MNKPYELVEIFGKKSLVKFMGNGDCISLDIVWNINGVVVTSDCLIPHGQKNIEYKEEVSDSHKLASILTLQEWSSLMLFVETSFEDEYLIHHQPSFRGYSAVPKVQVLDITDIDLYQSFLQTCSFGAILHDYAPDYFTNAQCELFEKASAAYINQHKKYLETKAKEFADFWTQAIGQQGTAKDFMIDAMMAQARQAESSNISEKDLEIFNFKAFAYAQEQFSEQNIPFFAVDYSPEWQLRAFLEDNNLIRLSRLFPIKTNFHIDFTDRPPFS